MKSKAVFTKKDFVVVLCSVLFLLMNICAIGAGGRRKAKEIVCLSNLHQWGKIWKLFTDDNDGQFVEELGWVGPLHPYYVDTEIFVCSSAKKPGAIATPSGNLQGGKFEAWVDLEEQVPGGILKDIRGSYGMSFWITHHTGGGRSNDLLWKTPHVRGASEAPVFMDSSAGGFCPLYVDEPPEYDGQVYTSDPVDKNEIRSVCLNRHSGGINCLFADFAARKVGLKELWGLRWHRQWVNPEISEWPAWMRDFKDY